MGKHRKEDNVTRCTTTLAATIVTMWAVTGASSPLNAEEAGVLPAENTADARSIGGQALALDVDALIADAVDRTVLLQRGRQRPSRSTGNNNMMRWIGLAMLGIGASVGVHGALDTCGASISSDFRSVDTSACWTRAGVGAGIAAAGAFVMLR